MILEKIKKFRESPERSVISFSMTDSVKMGKKADFCRGNGGTSTGCASSAKGGKSGGDRAQEVKSACKSEENVKSEEEAAASCNCGGGGDRQESRNSNCQGESSKCQEKGLYCFSGNVSGALQITKTVNVLLCDAVAAVAGICLVCKICHCIKRLLK